ncbi:alanine--tRNA ligase [Candidatus Micrarchaeota archaeon]|nr:alanine--tRNA ligase [Candidatus Micrarchaeota archaeon]
MLSKDFLRKEFAANPKKYYEVEVFKKEGFSRRVCPKCGKGFWSLGKVTCGDSSHEEYSFFKPKPLDETYVGFWKKFEAFWKKNNHEILPRYPVLSRWRDDLYFTIASIVDFQRLENGRVAFEYPANPLMVPQMCLRFPDIANIGITGRHFSCFMMAGQHSFNYPKQGYWKDECIRLNYEFLTKVLKADKEELTYGEDVWSMPDFSAFGPCIESFSKGSELVNSVFMQYRHSQGNEFTELDTKAIDVGWGFERLLWYYRGDYTAYDAVFPKELEFMKKQSGFKPNKELLNRYAKLSASLDVDSVLNLREEKQKIASMLGISLDELEENISPMQGLYAIADHSRALLFALSDGALPSNTAGGYNLRILARRAFGFMKEYDFSFEFFKLLEMQAKELKPLFPELEESLDSIAKTLDCEEKKYYSTLEKAKKIAGEIISRGERLSVEKMATLYESNGVTPEILEKAAREKHAQIDVPTNFYDAITSRHVMEKKAVKKTELAAPITRAVYYEDNDLESLDATVAAVKDNLVALDQTIFYPEGGGQVGDTGFIDSARVVDTQKSNGIILHYLDSKKINEFKVGQKVRLKLDAQRRKQITLHHSATHLVIQGAHRVLGKQVWQAGSKKTEDEGHVDITHFSKPSRRELDEIELEVNKAVKQALPIEVKEFDRGAAEKKHGFRLYQGGGAIGRKIRVVDIGEHSYDVQACGGTHAKNTKELGLVKITGAESVQDGVVRLHYKAGQKALEQIQKDEEILEKTTELLAVSKDQLPNAVEKMIAEWKAARKELEKAREELVDAHAVKLAKQAKNGLVEAKVDYSSALCEKLALKIAEGDKLCAVVSNSDGFVVVACNEASGKNAVELLKARGVGGGSEKFARGKLK